MFPPFSIGWSFIEHAAERNEFVNGYIFRRNA